MIHIERQNINYSCKTQSDIMMNVDLYAVDVGKGCYKILKSRMYDMKDQVVSGQFLQLMIQDIISRKCEYEVNKLK